MVAAGVARGPREVPVRTAHGSAYAVVGDADGDEHHRLRIYAPTPTGARLVHEEAPVSPRVHALGAGLLWVRRDAALRPHAARWWGPGDAPPVVLLDEPDRRRRLELRSTGAQAAVLASRGPGATRHWLVTAGPGPVPSCRPLDLDGSDADVVAWRDGVAVLDRGRGTVHTTGDPPLAASAPDGFVARHLQPVGDELVVTGRRDGRRALWAPARGPEAVWAAPPAGTLLPSVDPSDGALVLLVSSPVHRPQVVRAVPGEDLGAEPTGRARVHVLAARSDDGTDVPVTLLVPPGTTTRRPVLVQVYGAYGISLEGPFDPFTDDLLSRGVAVAYCHVRGGGEHGRDWHRQAVGARRHVPVDDLGACLDLLRRHPDLDAGRLVLSAASAGALTAAAACLRGPDRLRGLQLVHPFLDPVAALTDPAQSLTTTDWVEFGDPRHDPEAGRALELLSPARTVRDLPAACCPLPRLWVRVARHDARVDVAAAERFCRDYRAAARSTDPDHVVLHVTEGGHTGGGSAEDAHAENLLAHTWLLDVLLG